MATRVSIEYYGMEGSGRTMKEAKLDASKRIEAALHGSYEPILLTAGDESILCYREPMSGWCYKFIRNGELSCGSSHCGDRKETEKAARHHLGTNNTDWRTCFTAADVHPIVLDRRDREEIASNCEWQRKMQAAIAAGLDDTNARFFISGMTHLMTQPIPAGLVA